jgi:hypothetical protein
MADDSREILVRLGDPFNCPACGSRLSPPLQAIASRSRAVSAVAGCVAFAAAAGIGFGIVPLTRSAAASVSLQGPAAARYAPHFANGVRVAPPVEVELGSVTLAIEIRLPLDRPAQAISYGKPVGPEDEGAAPVRRWHHRAARHYAKSYFLPGPADNQTAELTDSDAASGT